MLHGFEATRNTGGRDIALSKAARSKPCSCRPESSLSMPCPCVYFTLVGRAWKVVQTQQGGSDPQIRSKSAQPGEAQGAQGKLMAALPEVPSSHGSSSLIFLVWPCCRIRSFHQARCSQVGRARATLGVLVIATASVSMVSICVFSSFLKPSVASRGECFRLRHVRVEALLQDASRLDPMSVTHVTRFRISSR